MKLPRSICKTCLREFLHIKSEKTENYIFRYEKKSTQLLNELRARKSFSIHWLSKLCLRKLKIYLKIQGISPSSLHYIATIPSYSSWYIRPQPTGMEYIAHYLANNLHIPYLDFLFKKKKHKQHTKKSYERYDSKAFIFLNRKDISFTNKNILLLDDVYTSGTTSLQTTRLIGEKSHIVHFYICKNFLKKKKLK